MMFVSDLLVAQWFILYKQTDESQQTELTTRLLSWYENTYRTKRLDYFITTDQCSQKKGAASRGHNREYLQYTVDYV